MPRSARVDVSGHCYHVLNRANARYRMFRRDADFEAFERGLSESVDRAAGSVSLLAYCVMGNHWHLVLKTHEDRAMGAMLKWLTTTHARRYRIAHKQDGIGHLYQGRYKSFLVGDDAHFLAVCRYVERNAVQARLVERAEDWRWSSLWRWKFGDDDARSILSPWPLGDSRGDRFNRPRQWLRTVNTPMSDAKLEGLRTSTERGRPYGSPRWVDRMVARHGLESTVRRPGRPRLEEA